MVSDEIAQLKVLGRKASWVISVYHLVELVKMVSACQGVWVNSALSDATAGLKYAE